MKRVIQSRGGGQLAWKPREEPEEHFRETLQEVRVISWKLPPRR